MCLLQITAEGHLKLADFGMSRKLKEGDGSKTNQTIGPAASMAPESIRNGTYSKKTGKLLSHTLLTMTRVKTNDTFGTSTCHLD
jgi:serine/threonine protein kinase